MIETDWRKVVTNPGERKIFEALEDSQWQWRTLAALSGASGLPPEQVRQVVESKYPWLVRKSLVPSQKGEDLYTLQSSFFERRNPLVKVWTFLSTSSSSM